MCFSGYGLTKAYHQTHFKEVRSDTHEDMNLPEEIIIQRRHPIVVRDAGEEIHENELAVTFATVSRLLLCSRFSFGTAFYEDDGRGTATSNGYATRSVKHEQGTFALSDYSL